MAINRKVLLLITGLFFLLQPSYGDSKEVSEGQMVWLSEDREEEIQVHLYFFWSTACSHCHKAKPFIEKLTLEYPWLMIHSYQLAGKRENAQIYNQIAAAIGEKPRGVPAFIYCGQMKVGFRDERTTGDELRKGLLGCYENARASSGDLRRANRKDEAQIVPEVSL